MFWERMRAQFGDTYAESVAKDYVLSSLGGRTVSKALADGEDAKIVPTPFAQRPRIQLSRGRPLLRAAPARSIERAGVSLP